LMQTFGLPAVARVSGVSQFGMMRVAHVVQAVLELR
jgi:hypothetical protein